MHLSKSQAPRGYLSGMAEARYLEKANAQENSRKKPRSHSLNAYDEYRSQDLNERMRLTEEGMQNNIKGNIRGHSIQEPSTTLEQLLTTLPDSIAFNLEISEPPSPSPQHQSPNRLTPHPNRIPHALGNPRPPHGILRPRTQLPPHHHPQYPHFPPL